MITTEKIFDGSSVIVFVPYSPRSFAGIVGDVTRQWPNAEVIPLVLEGETPPDGTGRSLEVDESGHFDLFAVPSGTAIMVVANGGPTPLGVAAVLLSLRLKGQLWNIQRDSVRRMSGC